MANKFTVDEFVVELGFTETVMKGLAKVEKQILPIANRIEKRLTKAFNVDAGKITAPGINRMVKNVEKASQQINKSLTKAFNISNAGSASANTFERNQIAAIRRVQQQMRTLYGRGGVAASGGVTTPRPATVRQSRVTPEQRINELATRQHQTAAYGRMQLTEPQRASDYSNRVNALRDQHLATGNLNGFRESIRSLDFEFAQQTRATAIATRQRIAAERAAATEAAGVTTGFAGLATGAGGLIAAFMTAQKAIEYFSESVQEGIKRTQAKTMLSTAFGSDQQTITTAINAYADRYGMDKASAQEQAAQLRMTLPEKQFSNAQIPQLLETESVFAHQTGMGQDQVGRFNYALQQIASSAKLMGQDWLQVVNASPALIKPLQELTGTSDTRQLREKLKAYTGGEVAKMMIQAMENLNNKSGAAAKAQDNMAASLGRLSNAQKDAQEQFFNGFSSGYKNLLNALTMNLRDGQGAMNSLGKALGWVFNRLASIGYQIDETVSNISGGLSLLGFAISDFYKSLDKDTRDKIDAVGKTFRTGLNHLVEATMAVFGLKMVGGALRIAGATAGRVGLAGAASAAGIGVRILSFASGLVLPVALGAFLGTKVDDLHERAEKNHLTPAQQIARDKAEHEAHKTPLFDYDNWEWVKSLKQHTNNFMNSPGIPAMAQGVRDAPVSRAQIEVKPIQFNPLEIRIPLPDGSVYATHVDVQSAINGNYESVMMAANGLSGGWQTQGQNAGFRPSQLMRQ